MSRPGIRTLASLVEKLSEALRSTVVFVNTVAEAGRNTKSEIAGLEVELQLVKQDLAATLKRLIDLDVNAGRAVIQLQTEVAQLKLAAAVSPTTVPGSPQPGSGAAGDSEFPQCESPAPRPLLEHKVACVEGQFIGMDCICPTGYPREPDERTPHHLLAVPRVRGRHGA